MQKSFPFMIAILALLTVPTVEASRWAILIGPDTYDDSAQLRPLRFAGSDVRSVAESLVATGHQPEQVIVMTSDSKDASLRPTKLAIYQTIRSVVETIGDAEIESLMVVFAGHGVNIEGRSYLCPSDGQLDFPERTLLPLADLSSLLARSRAAQKFLIVDACREEIGMAGKTDFNLLTGLSTMKLNDEGSQGLVYFASCLARQRSVEDPDIQHGIFMHYFSEALGGLADVRSAGNRDGLVSCHEAFQYASDQTRARSRELTGWEQQPWYEGRATAGMLFATLTDERRTELQQIAPEEPLALSGAVQHSQLALTEALYALQEGGMETVLTKSLEAIQLDPGNRMAYRTAAMAYQFTGNYEQAIATMAKIKEPVRVKATSGILQVRAVRDTVGTAKQGDVVEVVELKETADGTKWVRVNRIRSSGSADPVEVNGYVALADLNRQQVSREQVVADFGRQYQQPTELVQSWQPGTGRAAAALQRYSEIQSTINSIPYAPSIPSVPSIPYIGGFGGFRGR